MRKELKIIGSRDRHVFTATFIRFGFRDGYKGPVKTILLQDVLLDDKIVTDHLWFDLTLERIERQNISYDRRRATDEQIKKQAEEMAKPEVVTLKVCFDTYGLLYRPNTCVDVEIPFYDDEKIRDMLNKASADIMKWCDKNMIKYNKELKESRSTKKHCEGLRKHIANLERRLLRHTLANVILSIISVATIIALFTLIQN